MGAVVQHPEALFHEMALQRRVLAESGTSFSSMSA